jgi:hypothetical protein
MNRVAATRVLADHTLELQFDDGFVGRLDLTPILWGPAFEPLKDPKFFRQVRAEDGTIRWPNDADLCPNVLRYWCEAGGVKSQEDTEAYFEKHVTESEVT